MMSSFSFLRMFFPFFLVRKLYVHIAVRPRKIQQWDLDAAASLVPHYCVSNPDYA